MSTDSTRPRVGLLALGLPRFGQPDPEPRQQHRQWLERDVLPALAPIADVRFDGAVYRPEELEAVVAELDAAGLDAVAVICLADGPAAAVLPALEQADLPLVVWNTQELASVGETFSGPEMAANRGVRAAQELAGALARRGAKFTQITSHPGEPGGPERLADFFVAAAAVRALRGVRVGLLGGEAVSEGDSPIFAARESGQSPGGLSVVQLSVEDYVGRAAEAPAEDVRRLTADYREAYDVADDLTEEDLEATARAELSLRGLAAEHGLHALGYDVGALGQDRRTVTLPSVGVSRMMAEGIGFAADGDLGGAVGTWLLGRLCPPASASEISTIDFEGNGLLMSQAGEANITMARTDWKVPLVARARPLVPTGGRQLVLATSFQPGAATLSAVFRGPLGRWRLVAGRMQIGDFGPLPSIDAPHFKLSPAQGDVRDWLDAYAAVGGPAHPAVCFGDATGRIRATAGILDADYCEL